jgi:hypothetical protein
MPEQITVAFEVFTPEVELDHLVIMPLAPIDIIGDLALAGLVNHAAGDDELSVSSLLAGKKLIGGEDHVFETLDWIDGFNFTPALL